MPNAPKSYRPAWAKKASRQTQRAHDERRGSAHARGYTRRWQGYRRWYFSFPCNVLCGICGQKVATILDHVEAIDGQDDPLFWDTSNHLGECKTCAGRKTALVDAALGVKRTAEGERLLIRLKQVAAARAVEMGKGCRSLGIGKETTGLTEHKLCDARIQSMEIVATASGQFISVVNISGYRPIERL